jgi:hypothetical protein
MGPCVCGHSPEDHDPECNPEEEACDCAHYEEDEE